MTALHSHNDSKLTGTACCQESRTCLCSIPAPWGHKLPKSATLSWGRQYTPSPDKARRVLQTRKLPWAYGTEVNLSFLQTPAHQSTPGQNGEDLMYLTITPQTESAEKGTWRIHRNEWSNSSQMAQTKYSMIMRKTPFFYPFAIQLSSQICSSTSPCQLLSYFRVWVSFLGLIFLF